MSSDRLIELRSSLVKMGRDRNLFDAIACPSCMNPNLQELEIIANEIVITRHKVGYKFIDKSGRFCFANDLWGHEIDSEYSETTDMTIKCSDCYEILPQLFIDYLLEVENEQWAIYNRNGVNKAVIDRINRGRFLF